MPCLPFFSRKKRSARQNPPTPSAPAPKPYRHVPTHAAIDALTGAPASMREADATSIRAAHRRRISQQYSRPNSRPSSIYMASNRDASAHRAATLRRNTSYMTNSTSSYSSGTRQVSLHPGFGAYDFDRTVSSSRPRTLASRGRSPLSSPPLSPADSDAVSEASGSSRSEGSRSNDLRIPATALSVALADGNGSDYFDAKEEIHAQAMVDAKGKGKQPLVASMFLAPPPRIAASTLRHHRRGWTIADGMRNITAH